MVLVENVRYRSQHSMNNEHHECQSIFIASLRLNQSNCRFFIKIYIVFNRLYMNNWTRRNLTQMSRNVKHFCLSTTVNFHRLCAHVENKQKIKLILFLIFSFITIISINILCMLPTFELKGTEAGYIYFWNFFAAGLPFGPFNGMMSIPVQIKVWLIIRSISTKPTFVRLQASVKKKMALRYIDILKENKI